MCFCISQKVDDPEDEPECSEKSTGSSSKYRSLDSSIFSSNMMNIPSQPPAPGPPSRSSSNSPISIIYILSLLSANSPHSTISIPPRLQALANPRRSPSLPSTPPETPPQFLE